jgi:hypothetical protein
MTKTSRTDARVMNKDVQTTQPGICKDAGLFLCAVNMDSATLNSESKSLALLMLQ